MVFPGLMRPLTVRSPGGVSPGISPGHLPSAASGGALEASESGTSMSGGSGIVAKRPLAKVSSGLSSLANSHHASVNGSVLRKHPRLNPFVRGESRRSLIAAPMLSSRSTCEPSPNRYSISVFIAALDDPSLISAAIKAVQF